MKKTDHLLIASLVLTACCLYYPVLHANYFYTDEIVQLWNYRRHSNYHMFLPQGRPVTDALFQLLFSSIETIQQLTALRIFSFAGWMVSIPLWYYLIKKVVVKEKLPPVLVFFSILYLVSSPPFTLSIVWASCMELFMANTAGLLSGYCLYAALNHPAAGREGMVKGMVGACIIGLVALFTYQHGFGCFLLPFLLHYMAKKKITRTIAIAVAVYGMVYVLYYLLFTASVSFHQVIPSNRAAVQVQPLQKLLFFFARPLNSAFHFGGIINENNKTGFIISAAIGLAWLAMEVHRQRQRRALHRLLFPIGILGFVLLVYFPSLVVQENYASNRTLTAINMAVFYVVAETVLHAIRKLSYKVVFVTGASLCFAANAYYHVNFLFLRPVTSEYQLVRAYLENHYNKAINTIYFIRPPGSLFQDTYHITASWDEFGMPSTYPAWVPAFFVKQVVYEKTHNRASAEKLSIQHWLTEAGYLRSGAPLSEGILVIDVEKIMKANTGNPN